MAKPDSIPQEPPQHVPIDDAPERHSKRCISQVEIFCSADCADVTHAIVIDFMALVRKVPLNHLSKHLMTLLFN